MIIHVVRYTYVDFVEFVGIYKKILNYSSITVLWLALYVLAFSSSQRDDFVSLVKVVWNYVISERRVKALLSSHAYVLDFSSSHRDDVFSLLKI